MKTEDMGKEVISIDTDDWNVLNMLRAKEDALRDLIKHTNATTVDSIAILEYELQDTWLPWKRLHLMKCVRGFNQIRLDTDKYCTAEFTIIEKARIDVWVILREKYKLSDYEGYTLNYWKPEIWIYTNQKDDQDMIAKGEL